MGLLSGGLKWWEEWKLRFLVLSSLGVQFILFFAVWVRRVPALRRLRVVVWLAYIGGDALAIYALAALFNRHKLPADAVCESSRSSSSGLEVMWAPVLLIHLGGHATLSAFSLEDNELWIRHVVTLVSQVTVALYVFCNWWSGEPRLLVAAVLLFVFGILKVSLKPWSLRRASYSQMLASTDVSLPREEKGCSFAWWTWCSAKASMKKKSEGDRSSEAALSLDEYVQQAVKPGVQKSPMSCDQEGAPTPAPVTIISRTEYFVDVSAPYSGRLSDLRYLRNLPQDDNDTRNAYNVLQDCFEDTFDLLYTRVGFTHMEQLLVLLLPFLALVSVVLFATSHKTGYNKEDVKVTYILFSCTTLLEFLLPLCGIVLPCIPCLKFLIEYLDGWHDMVSQYNLISFYLRKKKPTFLMKLATFACLKEYVSKAGYVRQVSAAFQITELVQKHIEENGWNTSIRDAATYRSFSDLRGQLTLTKYGRLGLEAFRDSVKVPFDKSVLLWHIATDLCIHHPSSDERSCSHLTQRSMEISNYMLYLLFIRAEMLLPGTRPGLFTVAISQLEIILKNSEAKLENEETVAQHIIRHTTGLEGTLIHEACGLYVELMQLQQEERWEIIQGVWVEMICFSASRCRGYLHAKSLGEGGEYLSYVWLLWSYMGMETLADKIQKPASTGEQETVVVAKELASPSPGGLTQPPIFSSPV